ncbi:MAG: ABC transporter ATP-binding protein [Gammaproteobacteria bacterium]
MADDNKTARTRGYGLGSVDSVMSVDAVEEAASQIAQKPSVDKLRKLVNGEPLLEIHDLIAGYGRMEILHGMDLLVGKGQSLCLIGPNGAGKSTVLHSIFGFTHIMSGQILKQGQNITRMTPEQKLRQTGVAYILQDNSVFPDMTVTENLLMGGYLLPDQHQVRSAVEQVLDKHPRLAQRRRQRAGNLSGGERRLLEISRALIMNPDILLVDEPSIGLEPRYIDSVFEILARLQQEEGKTIIMVEQNAKKGLEFADIGYVLVSGQLALVGTGNDLLQQPEVGKLFLGG